MLESLPAFAGALLCCGAPALLIGCGFTIGRYGMPVAIRWRWHREPLASGEDSE